MGTHTQGPTLPDCQRTNSGQRKTANRPTRRLTAKGDYIEPRGHVKRKMGLPASIFQRLSRDTNYL